MLIDFFQVCQPKSYLPAAIRHNKAGWFVEFYAFNPLVQKRSRVKYRLNKYRQKFRTCQEFRVWTNQLCYSINTKLASGWSPFGEPMMPTMTTASTTIHQTIAMPMTDMPINAPTMPQVPMVSQTMMPTSAPASTPVQVSASAPTPKKKSRADEPLVKVLDKFIDEKSGELRETTLRTYKSFCRNIKAWTQKNYPQIKASEFGQEQALEYMEYVAAGSNSTDNVVAKRHDDGTLSARSYNNNLKQGRLVFSWAVSNCYAVDNPFAKIKVKREEEKQRILVPQEVRAKIGDYFREKNTAMLIVCDLTYSTLLRPIEISRIQIKYINIDEEIITMPGDKTKNHKNRVCRISPQILPVLREYVHGASPDDYLLADGSWRCGKVPMHVHTFSKTWDRMRKDLGLPKEMQLYSLRDTGINNMLKSGIDPLSVMQAADHHDLSMTTRYANHADPDLFKKLNELAPGF